LDFVAFLSPRYLILCSSSVMNAFRALGDFGHNLAEKFHHHSATNNSNGNNNSNNSANQHKKNSIKLDNNHVISASSDCSWSDRVRERLHRSLTLPSNYHKVPNDSAPTPSNNLSHSPPASSGLSVMMRKVISLTLPHNNCGERRKDRTSSANNNNSNVIHSSALHRSSSSDFHLNTNVSSPPQSFLSLPAAQRSLSSSNHHVVPIDLNDNINHWRDYRDAQLKQSKSAPAAANTVNNPSTTNVSPVSGSLDFLSDSIQCWSVASVGTWLWSIGLSEYDQFQLRKIDGDLLADLSDNDLLELGVADKFHRRKILKKINEQKIKIQQKLSKHNENIHNNELNEHYSASTAEEIAAPYEHYVYHSNGYGDQHNKAPKSHHAISVDYNSDNELTTHHSTRQSHSDYDNIIPEQEELEEEEMKFTQQLANNSIHLPPIIRTKSLDLSDNPHYNPPPHVSPPPAIANISSLASHNLHNNSLRIISIAEFSNLTRLNEGIAGIAYKAAYNELAVVVKQPKQESVSSQEWQAYTHCTNNSRRAATQFLLTYIVSCNKYFSVEQVRTAASYCVACS
jgi:hypothetical protein